MTDFQAPVTFRFPWAGDVTQAIMPVTTWFSPSGGNYSLFSVNLGASTAPELEAAILARAGSYGKQIGRIGEAVAVLVAVLEKSDAWQHLSSQEREAIGAAKAMLTSVAEV
ncbi:MAG: hypothetical protein GX458_04205, partial [Phyllobacteriaceae bacterium]|nr:hypothetical protein [Phyllobacteriaceae bacterium]